MRPLTFALLVGFSNAAIASLFGGYSVSGHMNQKHYEFKVSEADILRTPVWSRDADFPPLPARKAQDIARRKMEELLGTDKEPWVLRETTIADMGDDMHFVYVIQFEPAPGKEACTMCEFRIFWARVSPRIAVDGL